MVPRRQGNTETTLRLDLLSRQDVSTYIYVFLEIWKRDQRHEIDTNVNSDKAHLTSHLLLSTCRQTLNYS